MKKKIVTTIANRDELEQVMGEYAASEIERKKLTLGMEAEINAVRQRYESALSAHAETSEGLFEDLQAWAMLNPGAFTDKKSLALLHGKLGFRVTPPAVKQMPGVKAEHSIHLLVTQGMTDYFRSKTEIDKEAILADVAARKMDNMTLAQYGLRIEQKENFFTEINHEQTTEGR